LLVDDLIAAVDEGHRRNRRLNWFWLPQLRHSSDAGRRDWYDLKLHNNGVGTVQRIARDVS
jgi:hypothetical protein